MGPSNLPDPFNSQFISREVPASFTRFDSDSIASRSRTRPYSTHSALIPNAGAADTYGDEEDEGDLARPEWVRAENPYDDLSSEEQMPPATTHHFGGRSSWYGRGAGDRY